MGSLGFISTNTWLIIPIAVLFIMLLVYFLYIEIRSEIVKAQQKMELLIRSSVEPKFIEFSQEVNDIALLATEIWRIKSKISKISSELTDSQKRSIEASIDKFTTYLSQRDIEIIDYTGLKYNDGLNLDVLSINEGVDMEDAKIIETVEPAISYKGRVTRKAKVIL